MPNDPAALLESVRAALCEGNYQRLSDLAPVLAQVEAEVGMYSLPDLRALRAEAERTEACLQSALSGVRGARRRVAEITDAARGLTTYDRDGLRATFSNTLPESRRV
ncbi:MAG: hypothetical protein ACK4RZ_17155 [Paracoccaceae bacterium]